jgi:hypothetical protein
MNAKALLIAAAVVCLLTAWATASANAAVEETHVFDPALSLTGDCSTAAIDPVPDPGPCPGVPGIDHPSEPFRLPKAVTVDLHGDRYVASYGPEFANPNQGRIDVFDPEGNFITEIADPNGPVSVVVDSNGNLYVHEKIQSRLVRFSPTTYHPEADEITYPATPVVFDAKFFAPNGRMAINPTDGHLFADYEDRILEFGSAAEGNPLLDEEIGMGYLSHGVNPHGSSGTIAIDATRKRIYADGHDPEHGGNVIQVFELEAPHAFVATIDGSSTPAGEFRAEGDTQTSIAVEEATGHIFYAEYNSVRRIYELEADGSYVSTIQEPPIAYVGWPQLALDNGPESPTRGYLFAPSGEGSPGRDLAFAPKPPTAPPAIESVSAGGITETEAVLQAEIDPEGEATAYHFEYTSEQSFQTQGFAGAQLAGEGTLQAGSEGVAVSAPVSGLAPGASYRFRITAENESGEAEATGRFATYPAPDASLECPNEALRGGASAALPDCRAYELVTPPETDAHTPLALGHFVNGLLFGSRQASPSGTAVSFTIEGGTLPGIAGGSGSLHGDPYRATRGPGGWSTESTGPDGSQSSATDPGGVSPDQGYSFFYANGGEGFSLGNYLHYPDGHIALIGRGSLGTDPQARGRLISEGGAHVIFTSGDIGATSAPAVQLEEDAPPGGPIVSDPKLPPEGTIAIYDRTADEVTHVVSLLPEDVTPAAGENAIYQGASLDGLGVAFKIGPKLYLRYRNEETYEVGEGAAFAGVAEGGGRVFYLKQGNLFAYDVATEEAIPFAGGGHITPVNVAATGSAAYFVSPDVLTAQPGPGGAEAQPGQDNLYLSREGAISFVGTVTGRDVEGETSGSERLDGLGLWVQAVGAQNGDYAAKLGMDPSRATPDGGALLFESRAPLTGYDSGGHREVYRYDAAAGTLACLSCDPTGSAATGDASLQTNAVEITTPAPSRTVALIPNLRADGKRAFFQSPDQLVAADTDGRQDVYEWEAQGVGSCRSAGGCVYLISSGRSAGDNYLYSVSDSGDDVFFSTSDLLLPADRETAYSIYDARVGGGFPAPAAPAECLGEACQPAASAPALPPAAIEGAGNVKPRRHCPKGKRSVSRGGKKRCLPTRKKHHRKKHRAAKQAGRAHR